MENPIFGVKEGKLKAYFVCCKKNAKWPFEELIKMRLHLKV